jgi:hypothetical protein
VSPNSVKIYVVFPIVNVFLTPVLLVCLSIIIYRLSLQLLMGEVESRFVEVHGWVRCLMMLMRDGNDE